MAGYYLLILCGSSVRKIRRGRGNLLGSRAVRYELHPLVYPKIPDCSLKRAVNAGLLPRHYQSGNPHQLLQAYVGNYLKEEIAAEALTRNIPAFRVCAKINSQILSVKAPGWQGLKEQEYQAYSELSQRRQAGCIGA